MAPRPIRLVPDPVLREPCALVTAFDDDLADLARDMLDTMYAAPGRGLAAPQVGVPLRLVVMDATWKEGHPAPLILVNPEIIWSSNARETYDEACLSIPDRNVSVSRPAEVALRWQGLDGTASEGRFDGFAAVCLQHEVDHLDGILCIDRTLIAEATS